MGSTVPSCGRFVTFAKSVVNSLEGIQKTIQEGLKYPRKGRWAFEDLPRNLESNPNNLVFYIIITYEG